MTKEEIEAQGYTNFETLSKGFSFKYFPIEDTRKKLHPDLEFGQYTIVYNSTTCHLMVTAQNKKIPTESPYGQYTLFSGYCPSINEFIYVTEKLLKIK
jgi:hypothetical protein